jgi:hypothetical protein
MNLTGPPKSWTPLFRALRIDNQFLPPISASGVPPRRFRLHLPDNAYLRVNLSKQRNDEAPSIVTPASPPKRGLKLVKRADGSDRFDLVVADDVLDAPSGSDSSTPNPPVPAPQAAPAPAAAKVHFVLRPEAPPGLDVQRGAQRLLELVRKSKAFVTAGNVKSPSKFEKAELTKAKDAVVVWSGDNISSLAGELTFEPPLAGVTFGSNQIQAASEGANSLLVDRQRINSNDQVNERKVKIEYSYLFDNWIIQIEPFARIYTERPDTSNNELCEFWLVSASSAQENIRLALTALGGKRVLRSAPVDSARFAMAQSGLHLTVRPSGGAANCAASSSDLTAFDSNKGWNFLPDPSGEVGVMTKKVTIRTRGRWLLGLYAPQDIGVNVGSQSGAAIEDGKETIFRKLTTFLENARVQYFSSNSALNIAVGYDLAAMNSLEPTTPGFPESTVIIGQFRNPKPASPMFRLDTEGDKRYSAFIDIASTSSAPTFDAVGRMVERYAKLFDLSDERSSVAVYVGASTPTSGSCLQWKTMTENIANRLSGKPVVFGLVFTNVPSARIRTDLGTGAGVQEETLANRTKAYWCEGANQSAVLFVPFGDLVERDPTTVLEAAFSKIGHRVARQSD